MWYPVLLVLSWPGGGGQPREVKTSTGFTKIHPAPKHTLFRGHMSQTSPQ